MLDAAGGVAPAAALGPGNAANFDRTAEKFAATGASCEATLSKPDRTSVKPDLTFESIDKIDATELRSRNYVQTVVKRGYRLRVD